MSSTIAVLAINGLVFGLVIALIALGLSIIFGLLDVINLSHGDFFMVGTVVAYTVITSTGLFWPAFILAPAIGLVLGALIHVIVIKPLKNAAGLTIVATFGLSMIIQEVVRMTFGAAPKRLMPPIEGTFNLLGVDYEIYRIFAAVASIFAIGAFFLFLKKTKFGTWMRAVRHDRDTATALGIPTQRVFMITFGMGFAMAAMGGVVAAPITTVDFRTGVDILPFCFMAVIIGGLGNLPGTAAAAVLLAFMEGVISGFADPTIARICSLILMSAVLLFRPQGLFKGLAK
jgi:branched-chain amino acid transport system permease protein